MASLRDALTSMEKSVDGLIQKLTSASGTMAGRGGRVNTGSNFLDNSLGAFSTRPSVRAEAQFGLAMGAVQGTGRAISGLTQMMPQVSITMERMATSYDATIRAGNGMSRNQLQQMALSNMAGGITSPGSEMSSTAYLAMRGLQGNDLGRMQRGMAGAARYLNMSNESAAVAFAEMNSGRGSANMLRNFGIFTSDPRTGQMKSQSDIFGELYGRLSAGRGPASAEQVNDSFYRGALGATLRNSGMTEDNQELFRVYALERARGNNLDLSDPESVSAAMARNKAEGNENPNLPGYDLNTAKSGAMQNSQEAYLAGIKAVTPVLETLTSVGGALAGVFGGLTAAAGLAASSLVAVGAANALGGLGQAAGSAGMLGMAKRGAGGGRGGVRGVAGHRGKGVPKSSGATGGLGIKGGIGAAGAAVGGLSAVSSIGGAYETAQSGGDALGSVLGAAGSGAMTGASIGMFFGPKGALIGAAIGGLVGGVGGGIAAITGAGGEGGDQGNSNTNGTGAPQQFTLLHPTKSAQITAVFGQRESSFTKGKITWPNGHKGIDYAGKQGDTIYASESGYATLHDGGELGKRVRIKHANGMYTHYCHLSSISVREGQVNKGSPVGAMGNTGGKSTGVHLHFALSTGPDTGSAIDPMPYLGGGGNYLSSPPQDAEQSPSSSSPTSAGMTSAATSPGGEDSSPPNPTTTSSNMPSAKVDGISGAGSSPATGLESWSAGSVWSSGGGANTAAAPEGGEDASDQPGYLSPAATSSRPGSRQKNGRETKAVTNNVTINLSIAKGTAEEARRFANMLKQALEDETSMRMMARN